MEDKPETQIQVTIGIANQPIFQLYDPVLIQQFLSEEVDSYQKKQRFIFQNIIGDKKGLGIFFAEGKDWKIQRDIISQSFHNQNIVEKIPIIIDETNKAVTNLIKEGQKVKIVEFCEGIAGKVVSKTFFGNDFDDQWQVKVDIETELKEILRQMAEHSRFNLWFRMRQILFGRDFYDHNFLLTKKEKHLKYRVQRINNYIKSYIQQKLPELSKEQLSLIEKKNFFQIMVEAYRNEKIGLVEIVSNFIGFFFAGMETTGNLTGMCFYALAKYPICQQKLLKEIQDYFKENSIKQISDLKDGKKDYLELPYLKKFINETLRLYNPAPALLLREAIRDNKLGEFVIKKGWSVNCMNFWNLNNPNTITNPKEFVPERWDTQQMKNLHPFANIPFSAGKRNCIGKHLALAEAKIMLISILSKYEVNLVKETKLEFKISFLYQCKNDELVYFTKRQQK